MPQDGESMNPRIAEPADRRTVAVPPSALSRPNVAPGKPPRPRRSLNMAAHKIEYYRYH